MAIPKLYTIDEVGEVAHAPGSVLFWIYSGKLASVKVGRRRLVAEDALRRFLGLDGPSEGIAAKGVHTRK